MTSHVYLCRYVQMYLQYSPPTQMSSIQIVWFIEPKIGKEQNPCFYSLFIYT